MTQGTWKQWVAGAGLLAGVTTGCAVPPTPQEVAERTSTRVAALVEEGLDAMATAGSMRAANQLVEGSLVLQGRAGNDTQCPPETPECQPAPPAPEELPAEQREEIEKGLAELKKVLTERVFTEENIESESGNSVVFRIDGQDVCRPETGEADPECVARVDAAQPRLKVTAPQGEDLDITLMLGAQQSAPLTLRVREASVAVETDLGQLKPALSALGEEGEESAAKLPATLEGRVELKLTKNGEKDFTVSTSILSRVRVEGTLADYGQVRFASEPASPFFSLRMEAAHKRTTVAMDAKATTYAWPAAASYGEQLTGELSLELAGLSFAIASQPEQRTFHVTHVGLGAGQSAYKLDGQPLLTLDVNPEAGRAFDVDWAFLEDGQARIGFSPELDVRLGFDLRRLSAAGIPVATGYELETYRFRLSESPRLHTLAANPETGMGGGLALEAGRLAFTAGSGASVTAEAGQCVTHDGVLEEGENPVLGVLAVAACQ